MICSSEAKTQKKGPPSGVDELLTCAETAARAAKAAGGGRACTFDAAMQVHSEEQLTVERQLRQALLEQQFSLAYQPIADLGDGRIVGVEALIRWNHPTRGVVAPAEFVPWPRAASRSRLTTSAWATRHSPI